tara:strand:+ start:219 stop:344 length:126 start_codon:yes stop_codon:yes gene_type:complete
MNFMVLNYKLNAICWRRFIICYSKRIVGFKEVIGNYYYCSK